MKAATHPRIDVSTRAALGLIAICLALASAACGTGAATDAPDASSSQSSVDTADISAEVAAEDAPASGDGDALGAFDADTPDDAASDASDDATATADGSDAAADGPSTDAKPGICKVNADCAWFAVNACQSAVCLAGDCTAATMDCADTNPCTQDSCSAAKGCSHTAVIQACSDGDPCTQGDLCDAWGDCQPGPSPCADKGSCLASICSASPVSPGYGCSYPAIADGSPCSDHPCWSGDFCKGGKCIPGPTAQCDDGHPCTLDSCSATGVCVFSPAAAGTPYSPGSGLPTLACAPAGSCANWIGTPWKASWLCAGPCAAESGLPAGWSFSSSSAVMKVESAPFPSAQTGNCARRLAGSDGGGATTGLCSLENGGCQFYTAQLDGPPIDLSKAPVGVKASAWLNYQLDTGGLALPKLAQLQLIAQGSGAVLASTELKAGLGSNQATVSAPAQAGVKMVPRIVLQMANSQKPAAVGAGLWLLNMVTYLGLPPENCSNGLDDNGDGQADCKDSQCSCTKAESGLLCSDGLDNDADDAIDCADTDCAKYANCGKLLYANSMNCGSKGWVALPEPLTKTQASWAVDPLPAGIVGPSGGCALGFDNGVNFTSPAGISWGAVSTPDAFLAPAGMTLLVYFKAYLDVETTNDYDMLRVRLSADPLSTCTALPAAQVKQCLTSGMSITKSAETMGKWTTYYAYLKAPAAKVWLVFGFDSVDTQANVGKGVFIDDLAVHVAP